MADRDELAEIIAPVLVRTNPNKVEEFDGLPPAGQRRWLSRASEAADAILAAGWRKPRTLDIEALGDLETPGIVIRDANGRVAELSRDEGFGNVWKPSTWQDAKFGLEACMFDYPVTVLYNPRDGE